MHAQVDMYVIIQYKYLKAFSEYSDIFYQILFFIKYIDLQSLEEILIIWTIPFNLLVLEFPL